MLTYDAPNATEAASGLPYTTTSELAYVYRSRANTPDTKQSSQHNYPPSSSVFRTARRKGGSQGSSDATEATGASLYNLATSRANASQTSLVSTSTSFSTHSTSAQTFFGGLTQSLPRLIRRQQSRGLLNDTTTDSEGNGRASTSTGHYHPDQSFVPRWSTSDSGDVEALEDESDDVLGSGRNRRGFALGTDWRSASRTRDPTSLYRSSSAASISEVDRMNHSNCTSKSIRMEHQRSQSATSTCSEQLAFNDDVQKSTASQNRLIKSSTASSMSLPMRMEPPATQNTKKDVCLNDKLPVEGKDASGQIETKGNTQQMSSSSKPQAHTRVTRSMSILKRAAHKAISHVNHHKSASSSSAGWDKTFNPPMWDPQSANQRGTVTDHVASNEECAARIKDCDHPYVHTSNAKDRLGSSIREAGAIKAALGKHIGDETSESEYIQPLPVRPSRRKPQLMPRDDVGDAMAKLKVFPSNRALHGAEQANCRQHGTSNIYSSESRSRHDGIYAKSNIEERHNAKCSSAQRIMHESTGGNTSPDGDWVRIDVSKKSEDKSTKDPRSNKAASKSTGAPDAPLTDRDNGRRKEYQIPRLPSLDLTNTQWHEEETPFATGIPAHRVLQRKRSTHLTSLPAPPRPPRHGRRTYHQSEDAEVRETSSMPAVLGS